MSAPARLASFALVLVLAVGAGAGIGATLGPDAADGGDRPDAGTPAPLGEGVVAAVDGYRLAPEGHRVDPDGGPLRFAILGPSGSPERRFTPVHERDLHLIVVNQELTSFEHLHPELGHDGTWSVELPPLEPGAYRAVADFMVTDGPRLALGTTLSVPGDYQPRALPDPSPTAHVDGYDLTLSTEHRAGGVVVATLVVREDDHPVELEPYLGARGHLVAMRAGDLAYAHVHPLEATSAPGTVVFEATLTAAGRYALFLDFLHAGLVHTAAFTFDQGAVRGAAEMEHGADG